MPFLDMRTIIFSYILTDIVCLLVIILLWRQTRLRFAGTGFWVFDYFCQTLALVLIVLRGIVPDWASMVLSNTLVVSGALLGYMGLLRFAGQKQSQIHNYAVVGLFALIHTYFSVFEPNLSARNINISVGLLIISFQCAWLLLYLVPADMRKLTRGVGVVFVCYCLISIGRILFLIATAHQQQNFFQSGTVDAAVIMTYQILFILLTYSLVLMFNKRLLTDLTDGEEKFSKAFLSSPYAILLTKMSDGKIMEVNKGFIRLFGYEAGEAKGKTTLALSLWEKEADRISFIDQLTAYGRVQSREISFRKKTGEMRTGLISAELIDISGEKYILSSVDDISERKKAQAELGETRDYLENLLNYANAPIIVWDNNFQITKFNKAFQRLTGLQEQDALGRRVDILFPAETRDKSMEYIKKASSGERWEVIEIEIQHLDGSVHTLLWNSAVIYQPDTKIIQATIAQGHDITERKNAQKEILRLNENLNQKVAGQTRQLRDNQLALLNLVDDLNAGAREIAAANQSLEATNKELAAFSYSVSHDLRAPLRSIDGFSNALMEDCADQLNTAGKSYLQRIVQAAKKMNQLIEDLLGLSRVLKSDFYRQKFDLSALAREIATEIQKRNPQKNYRFEIQDNILVLADQRLLGIAMTNLLDNACKFSGKSEFPLIEFGAEVQNGKTVFFVRDNGAGFNMEYVDKIFESFQRLHPAEEYPGTGIGLATVQRIIHRHEGRIWAKGEPGKGATFYFTLD